MALVVFAICFLGGLAACTYLVVNGHPWFGAFVLLLLCCLSVSSERTKKKKDKEDGE